MKRFTKKYNTRHKIFSFLRFSIGFLIVFYLIRTIEINGIVNLYNSVNLKYIAIAAFLYILDRLVADYRWNCLLKSKDVSVPLYIMVEISLVGQFIGKFLPSSLAPDAVRAYGLSKETLNTTESVSSVFVDRFISFLSLLIVALFGASYSLKIQEIGESRLIFFLFAMFMSVLFLSTLVIFANPIILRLLTNYGLINRYKLIEKIVEFYESMYAYNNKKSVVFKAFALSLFTQVLRCLIAYVSALALGVYINVLYFFVFIPTISLILMLPLTIGGLGVAEGAYMYFFSRVGMLSYEAFAVCLLLRVLTLGTILLPGGIIFVMRGLYSRKLRPKSQC